YGRAFSVYAPPLGGATKSHKSSSCMVTYYHSLARRTKGSGKYHRAHDRCVSANDPTVLQRLASSGAVLPDRQTPYWPSTPCRFGVSATSSQNRSAIAFKARIRFYGMVPGAFERAHAEGYGDSHWAGAPAQNSLRARYGLSEAATHLAWQTQRARVSSCATCPSEGKKGAL